MKDKKLIIPLLIIIILVLFKDVLLVNFFAFLIVKRGILAPNCLWWKISDFLLKDGSGINLYNSFKNSHSFHTLNIFGQKMHLVLNIKHIKTILDNSPYVFGVGKLKKTFFKSFMSKNVGVSQGKSWKRRRLLNEKVLFTDKIHKYSQFYNNLIKYEIINHKTYDNFDDFTRIGKRIAMKIVFNENLNNKKTDKLFDVFSQANSIKAFMFNKFGIDEKILRNYISYLKKHIKKPNDYSLVKLCTMFETNEDEIIHQIPHFMFPIVGNLLATIPRLILLLIHHPKVFSKVIDEIRQNFGSVQKLQYLRKCILETLRLNNPVVTTYRTLLQDFKFDNKNAFPKGTEFIILNNPILREKEKYKFPNRFIPERWNDQLEKSYYAMSFNQGPQRCPGKSLAIFILQSFIMNLFKSKGILKNGYKVISSNIKNDKNNIPQMNNPCTIKFGYS